MYYKNYFNVIQSFCRIYLKMSILSTREKKYTHNKYNVKYIHEKKNIIFCKNTIVYRFKLIKLLYKYYCISIIAV
jgi:hypothetical protein